MRTGRAVINKKMTVEDCRWIAIFGMRCQRNSSVTIPATGQHITLSFTGLIVGKNAGHRAWFLCPGCGTRAAVLYSPPGEKHFLCRHCHRLTYYQRQIHRDRWSEPLWRAVKVRERAEAFMGRIRRNRIGRARMRQYESIMRKIAWINTADIAR